MIVGISDIHAYYDKLVDLMIKLEDRIDFSKDTLVFLGDYVDGGTGSSQVIELLMAYQQMYPQWVFLKGNHEDMLLDAVCYNSVTYGFFDQWFDQGGKATLESYLRVSSLSPLQKALAKPIDLIPHQHLLWMENCPLFYETDSFIFVHAGLKEGVQPHDTPMLDALWLRTKFINSHYDWGKRIIFGHTYQKEPLVLANKIGIDTCHHGGGPLTAVLLDDERPEWFEFIQSAE